MVKIRFTCILITICSFVVNAQQQNPTSIKWRKINSEHFRVIFPESIEHEAERAITYLEKAYHPVSKTLDVNPPKIPLLLFNQAAYSNGWVQLAPRKMAWYTTPMQDANSISGNDWFQSLALHEFRHVAQFKKADQGFNKFASVFFGDLGKLALEFWSTPVWFIEGDAIVAENKFSTGGRGRNPEFELMVSTPFLDYEKLNYDKAYLGSYKKYFPSHYHLGFFMTNYVNRNFDESYWDYIGDRTSKHSISPFAFSRSLKKATRLNVNRTFKATHNDLSQIWDKKYGTIENTPSSSIISPENGWTNFTYPQFSSTGELYVLNYGFDNRSRISRVENNEEKILFNLTTDDKFSLSGDEIVWASVVPDPRWGERSYSDIYVYNISEKSKTRLTKKQKYFAPAISPDGTRICAVEYTPEMVCNLVILDRNTGIPIKKVQAGNNDYIRMPSWSDDGKKIVFTHTTGQKTAISYIDVSEWKIHPVKPYSFEHVTNPVFFNDFILFNSPVNGIGEIHALHLSGDKRFILVQRQRGAYNPHVSTDKKTIIYQEYSVNGYKVNSVKTENLLWKEINTDPNEGITRKMMVESMPVRDFFDSLTIPDYQSKKFIPVFNYFKPHSWTILPNYDKVNLQVLSSDLLNTLNVVAGLEFNKNEFATALFGEISYSGLYPIITTGAFIGERTTTYEIENEEIEYEHFNEKSVYGYLTLPLNFSRNQTIHSAILDAGLQYVRLYNLSEIYDTDGNLYNGELMINQYAVNYSLYKSPSYRDITPRLGINSFNSFYHTPYNKDYSGNFYSTRNFVYFPGIFNHHSLRIETSWEMQEPGVGGKRPYHYSSNIEYLHGFDYEFHEHFTKFGAAYYLPIAYPDFAMGPVAYLKRIRGQVFYNRLYTDAKFAAYNESFGAEVKLDMSFLRVLLNIDLGLRYSYLPGLNNHVFEFVILDEGLTIY